MNTRHKRLTLILTSCLLAVAATAIAGTTNHGPARALFTRPEVQVNLTVAVQKGNSFVPLPKEPLKSGAILQWNINSKNSGDREAEDYVASSPIPEGTTFVAGSATSPTSASVSYSIDNGRTFDAVPMVEIKQPDNSIKLVPAPVTAYTAVRYEWSDALPPGQTFTASYNVRVK